MGAQNCNLLTCTDPAKVAHSSRLASSHVPLADSPPATLADFFSKLHVPLTMGTLVTFFLNSFS